jgi:hypothetical protein
LNFKLIFLVPAFGGDQLSLVISDMPLHVLVESLKLCYFPTLTLELVEFQLLMLQVSMHTLNGQPLLGEFLFVVASDVVRDVFLVVCML